MRDLNARVSLLGSGGTTLNENGKAWFNYINENNHVTLLGEDEPTHKRGGRIDYACTFGDYWSAVCNVSNELHSDHFALVVDCNFQIVDEKLKRTRLTFDKRQTEDIVNELNSWFETFKEKEDSQDIDLFCESLVNEVHRLLGNNGKFGPKNKRTKMKEIKRWYNNDPILKRISREMKAVVKRVKRNPSKINLDICANLEKQYSNAKNESRANYWSRFISEINNKTRLKDIWNKINIARGKRNKEKVDHNPQNEVNKLAEKWANGSNRNALPNRIKHALNELKSMRTNFYKEKIGYESPIDADFTEFEFTNALKTGKSTAPGIDGITYDIIALLAMIKGNPLLKLFNLIFKKGKLPKVWKEFLMIPIPRGGTSDRPRPISLGSCLCKMFERLLLNRIMHVMKERFNDNMFGFLPGRGTAEAIAAFHCNKSRYAVFLDLESAFDKANKDVILYNLGRFMTGRIVRIVEDLLGPRKIKVFSQGKLSGEKIVNLGTPQGGVISPTLFNILMMNIADIKLPPGCKLIIYADDICIQSETHEGMKIALRKIEKMCLMSGLIISTTKTKAIYLGNGKPSRLLIDGNEIDFVDTYKYLGVYVGRRNASKAQEVNRIITSCKERIRPMRALAMGNKGVPAGVLRRMYIGFIRPIIDYAACSIKELGDTRLKKLEAIQNEALRVILGVPKTVQVECLREECRIESVRTRVNIVMMNTCLRIISDTRSHPLKDIVENKNVKANAWAREIKNEISSIDLHVHDVPRHCHPLEPWLRETVDVRILKRRKKCEMINEEEKAFFLEQIEKCKEEINSTCCHFTDGSLLPGGNAGCGVTVEGSDIEFKVRLGNNASSTQSEIFALLLAIKNIYATKQNGIIVSDSQSALKSINSKILKCKLNQILVNRIHVLIHKITRNGQKIIFLWIPSHVGISGNERADCLAREGAQKPVIDYDFGLSREQHKRIIASFFHDYEEKNLRDIEYLKHGFARYRKFNKKFLPIVSVNKVKRIVENAYVRIKIGYKYLWEYCRNENYPAHCQVCRQGEGHRLEHYLRECSVIGKYRNKEATGSLDHETERFLDLELLDGVIENHKGFASPF